MALKTHDIVLLPIEANDTSGFHSILLVMYPRQRTIISMDSGDHSGNGLLAMLLREVCDR